jgi:hypothetical protein
VLADLPMLAIVTDRVGPRDLAKPRTWNIRHLVEGRRTFTNINRYLLCTMVSNYANVMIVAIASLFLSYLPLLRARRWRRHLSPAHGGPATGGPARD